MNAAPDQIAQIPIHSGGPYAGGAKTISVWVATFIAWILSHLVEIQVVLQCAAWLVTIGFTAYQWRSAVRKNRK